VAALVAHNSAQLTPIDYHCSVGLFNDSKARFTQRQTGQLIVA